MFPIILSNDGTCKMFTPPLIAIHTEGDSSTGYKYLEEYFMARFNDPRVPRDGLFERSFRSRLWVSVIKMSRAVSYLTRTRGKGVFNPLARR